MERLARNWRPHDSNDEHSDYIGILGTVGGRTEIKEMIMTWTTPTLVEICIGLEINGYLPAEF